jgi:hypothetical protein
MAKLSHITTLIIEVSSFEDKFGANSKLSAFSFSYTTLA